MKKVIPLVFIFFLFVSCSVEYELDQSNIIEIDRLAVNSFLNPNDPIQVYFYSTSKTDSGYIYTAQKGVEVLLKENETVLFQGICSDTLLHLDYHPKVGKTYSINIFLENYDPINASTTIPYPIGCEAIMNFSNNIHLWSQYLVYLTNFNYLPDDQISLWITSYKIFETKEIIQYNEIFANNLLLDQFNREEGAEILNDVVGSIYFNGFLRVKNKNLPNLDELIFTPTYAHHPSEPDPDSKQNQIQIKLITASKEYDQYNKTLYEQKAMIIYDDDISSIIYQPTRVYGNIQNGFGIFAGMNEMNYYFNLPQN